MVFPPSFGIVSLMPVSEKDVIIIGAGASGLICAAECGKRGSSVLVLDHADRACAKGLVSGIDKMKPEYYKAGAGAISRT